MKAFFIAMLSEEGSKEPSTKRGIAVFLTLIIGIDQILVSLKIGSPPPEYMVLSVEYIIIACLFGSVAIKIWNKFNDTKADIATNAPPPTPKADVTVFTEQANVSTGAEATNQTQP